MVGEEGDAETGRLLGGTTLLRAACRAPFPVLTQGCWALGCRTELRPPGGAPPARLLSPQQGMDTGGPGGFLGPLAGSPLTSPCDIHSCPQTRPLPGLHP